MRQESESFPFRRAGLMPRLGAGHQDPAETDTACCFEIVLQDPRQATPENVRRVARTLRTVDVLAEGAISACLAENERTGRREGIVRVCAGAMHNPNNQVHQNQVGLIHPATKWRELKAALARQLQGDLDLSIRLSCGPRAC